MNKNNSHIDNLVREKLRGLTREPRMDDFEKIMNKMDSAESSRRLFPWWFSLFLLAVLSAGAYLYIQHISGAETPAAVNAPAQILGTIQKDKDQPRAEKSKHILPLIKVSAEIPEKAISNRRVSSQSINTAGITATQTSPVEMEAFPFEEADLAPAKSYVYFPSLLSHFGLVQYVIPDTAFTKQERKIVYPRPYTYRSGYFSVGVTVLSGQSSLDMKGNGYNHPSYNEKTQKGYNAATAYGARILVSYNMRHLHLQFGVGYNEIAMSSSFRFNNRYLDSIPVYNSGGQRLGYKYVSRGALVHASYSVSRMKYMTLPVGLAYDVDLSTRWALGAQTSLNTSFFIDGDGLLLDPKTLTLNDIESYGNKINPVLFTTDLGMYLKHRLTPYVDLQAGLAYRTSLSPVFDERFGANSKANSYMMSAGLQFRIR